MSDPRYYQVDQDRDGFFIVDDEGEEVEWPNRRYTSEASAKQALDEMVEDFMRNYEPPELGDAWSGGFAENH